MININIVPAKSRFGLPKRKQWKFQIIGGNGEPLDPRDTYANPADIFNLLQKLRWDRMDVHVHYEQGVETTTLPLDPPF
jgi:hypothetical protein